MIASVGPSLVASPIWQDCIAALIVLAALVWLARQLFAHGSDKASHCGSSCSSKCPTGGVEPGRPWLEQDTAPLERPPRLHLPVLPR